MKRVILEKYLNDLYQPDLFQDYCPNGLQVEGKDEISRIGFAVSATQESAAAAVNAGCDCLIVHHGLFWKFHGAKPLIGPFAKRVMPLVKHEINLFGYHLPMDGHMQFGNAAGIARRLGLEMLEPFLDQKSKMPFGVSGGFQKPTSVSSLQVELSRILNHDVLVSTPNNEKTLNNIAIITGGACDQWQWAKDRGFDAYLTGEMREHHWHDAKESGISMFAGGHHATERFGVLDLMKHLNQKFSLQCVFFDSVNPA